MTLEETLKRMQELSSSFAQAKDQAEDAEFKVEDNSQQGENKEEGPKFKTSNRAKRLYVAQSEEGGKPNGDGTYTGQVGALNGKSYISTNAFKNLLSQDKSGLIGAAQQKLNVAGADGKKSTEGVEYVGLKYNSKTKELSPEGDKVGVTDFATLNKVSKEGVPQQDGEVAINEKDNLPAIPGDENAVIQQTEKDTDSLAKAEGEGSGNAIQLSKNDLTVFNQIQGEVTNITNQFPQQIENGNFQDIQAIYQKYMQDAQQTQDTATQANINSVMNGKNPLAPALPEPSNTRKAAGDKASDPKKPIEGLKKIGGILGGVLGGIMKLAGMFLGGVAAGQANGR